jgi:hypothetical protein
MVRNVGAILGALRIHKEHLSNTLWDWPWDDQSGPWVSPPGRGRQSRGEDSQENIEINNPVFEISGRWRRRDGDATSGVEEQDHGPSWRYGDEEPKAIPERGSGLSGGGGL